MSNLSTVNPDIKDAVNEYINRKLRCIGDFNYAYLLINKKNPVDLFVASNYPSEWYDVYIKNNYQFMDPVVLHAFKRVYPFSWDENISMNSILNFSKIFKISSNYNITNGYTFVLHDGHHHMAMLSIVLQKIEGKDIEDEIKDKKADLHFLLMNIYEKTKFLYEDELCELSGRKPNKNIFSGRENEILYWASIGKTYQEISIILGIKVSTVKFHIGNVVRKLGVINAKHAIKLGTELNLIKPIK
ncbi:MAG: Transcriptional activator protein EsaR [Candidatus Erwinia impunctatus]|nr:Transcriptional activator protein EsaR [Culicoides impunctatus]